MLILNHLPHGLEIPYSSENGHLQLIQQLLSLMQLLIDNLLEMLLVHSVRLKLDGLIGLGELAMMKIILILGPLEPYLDTVFLITHYQTEKFKFYHEFIFILFHQYFIYFITIHNLRKTSTCGTNTTKFPMPWFSFNRTNKSICMSIVI